MIGYGTYLFKKFTLPGGQAPTSGGSLVFPTNLTSDKYDAAAKCLNEYIAGKRKKSPLKTYGMNFIKTGAKGDVNVNPALLVAIAGAESEWATNGRLVGKLGAKVNCYNFYSLKATKYECPERVNNQDWRKFNSWEEAIDEFGSYMRRRYLSQGLDTIEKIGVVYCEKCANWIPNVTTYFNEITKECPIFAPPVLVTGQARRLKCNDYESMKREYGDCQPVCGKLKGNNESAVELVSVEYLKNPSKPRGAKGKVWVHKKVADVFKKVFKEIAESKVDYNFTDVQSYCCRYIGSSICRNYSLHAFGLAIDINPKRNPHCPFYPVCKKENVLITDLPPQVIEIFKRNGFRWGGDYKSSKDAMHFEYCR